MGERVLIIDDEADFAEYVSMVAKTLGLEVHVCTAPAEATRAIETFRPTLILLDIVMPVVDGIELVQWLAARHDPAAVVLVTGFSTDYAQWAKVLGETNGLRSVRVLSKPVRLSDLRAVLRKAA